MQGDNAPAESFSEELVPGTYLFHGQYRIERFLNSGGFALTYLARDSLNRIVVIKECFPATLCGRRDDVVCARSQTRQDEFRAVVRLFVNEARRLARLDHEGVVGVHQVFEDNGTAYMALDYIEGLDLNDLIEASDDVLAPLEVQTLLMRLLDAVAFIHDQNLLHRDIAPDNILIDPQGNPVLIDFGAARESASRASRVLSSLHVVKDGYSPQEFYIAGADQGPSGDLYSLAATFYHLITGDPPPNSQLRLAALAANEPDPLRPLAGNYAAYNLDFLAAIDKALAVKPANRPQSAREWLSAIDPRQREKIVAARARHDKEMAKAISELVQETNRAVAEAQRLEAARARQAAAKTAKPQKRKKVFFEWQLEEDCDEDLAGIAGRGSADGTGMPAMMRNGDARKGPEVVLLPPDGAQDDAGAAVGARRGPISLLLAGLGLNFRAGNWLRT
ncbi:serine/threonine protein kinase [Rhodovulum iodosum]|nr:serine/threonine protein kinase [Rhodovulum robiginosum]